MEPRHTQAAAEVPFSLGKVCHHRVHGVQGFLDGLGQQEGHQAEGAKGDPKENAHDDLRACGF